MKKIDSARANHYLEKETEKREVIYIVDMLGEKMPTLLVEERLSFGPHQVRCICQIKKGLKYQKMHKDSKRQIYTVTKEPFIYQIKDRSPGWWMEVECENDLVTIKKIISLHDNNIFPYESGKWNKINWLAFTKESKHLAHSCCR